MEIVFRQFPLLSCAESAISSRNSQAKTGSSFNRSDGQQRRRRDIFVAQRSNETKLRRSGIYRTPIWRCRSYGAWVFEQRILQICHAYSAGLRSPHLRLRRQRLDFLRRQRAIVKCKARELRRQKLVAGIIRVAAQGNTARTGVDVRRYANRPTRLAIQIKRQLAA